MATNSRLSVTHFYREPRETGFSIEGIFKTVKDDLGDRLPIRDAFCDPHLSRLRNTLNAAKYASAVNHITGDVNYLAMGLKDRKNILTIHDFGFYENPVHSKLKHLIYHQFWFKLPLRHTSFVTVVSEFTRQKLIDYFQYPDDRIQVIPPPLKPVFKYMYKDELANKPVILMIGSGKHKNLGNLIEAVKDLNVHIDIVGSPSLEEMSLLATNNLSHTIHKHLSEEQVFDRYTRCDILFTASLYEGFCMPIIEAQAVGRPVITGDTGGMKEVANGSAMLVDPRRPDHIRDAISTLIADRGKYGALVTHGLRNAARFDHKLISEQYFRLYLELHKQ